MDTITHGLLGATIAEAAFRRKLGGRAPIVAAVCAMAPDLDHAARLGGEFCWLTYHRGVAHSLIALAAAAPIAGVLASRITRENKAIAWTFLALVAFVSHALLDACTPYGTELLAPLTDRRFAIDAISIADPFYSLPLAIAGLLAVRGRDRARSARFARIVLGLTTAYLALGFVQSERASAWARDDLAHAGFAPLEVRAFPTLGNVLVHRVVARGENGRFRIAYTSAPAPRALRWYALRDDDDPLVDAFRTSERGRLVERVAMGMASFELRRGDSDFTVRESDLRYGSIRDPRIAFRGTDARYGLEGQLLDVSRRDVPIDAVAELATLWAFVVGDDAKLDEQLARIGSMITRRCAAPRGRARGAR